MKRTTTMCLEMTNTVFTGSFAPKFGRNRCA